MTDYLRTPDTPADTLRDTLLGALVGLARSTSSEPKTENTDAVLNAGLRLAAQPDAPAETLQRMLDITRAEKHAVAPNCATCAMPCGNTKDYDLTRLRSAAPAVRQRKLRLLQAVFRLAAQHPDADVQLAIYRGLFAFSEDWDEELLDPVIAQTEKVLPPVKSARRTRRIYPICFSPKSKPSPVGKSPDFRRETGISAPRTAAGTFLCIADPVSCRFCEIFLEKGFTNEPQKIII